MCETNPERVPFPSFLDLIHMNSRAKSCVLSANVSYEEAVRGYDAIINGEQFSNPRKALAIVSAAAYSIALPEYRKRGISDDIALSTFTDIPRWEEEYERTHNGEPGLGEVRWLANHLQLRIFALGSLQYQLRDQIDDLYTLNLHIPKGSDISQGSVRSSFRKAKQFFGKDPIRLCCSSWLLSEELSRLLDDSSRIKAFSSMFTIVSSDYSRRQAEERIFGILKDDPEDYEAVTSLAGKAREHLIHGGKLPVTSGFLII